MSCRRGDGKESAGDHRSSRDGERCRPREEYVVSTGKGQRGRHLRSAGDEWQGGGRVARGEEYIGQAKLMGWGEEIRTEFGKGLEYLFLIYLCIGLAKTFTSARYYGKTSMNFWPKQYF